MRKLFVVWLLILFTALAMVSCHDECDPEETRCKGDKVQTCNAKEDWELSVDCSEIDDFGLGLEWQCCVDPKDGLHSCLPSDECENVDGGA